jgi:ABC-type transport system substrate-binding protein
MRSIRASSSALRSIVRGVGLALALAIAGCSTEFPAPIPSAHPDSAEPRRGGVLILEAMFAGLVDYDLDGKIVPDLADHWTVSEDGRSIRFVLREGVRFHDGDEVTADDVKRSVERALHPSAPNPYSTYFASILGYAAFTEKKAEHLEGVSVEGRYVVTFTLDKPDAAFMPLLAMHPLRPVCKSGGTRYSDTWMPCGAGPFKLMPGGWDRGRQITVVRHEGYFRPGLPHLDAVRYLFHVNFTSQRFKFTSGQQDILRDFLAPDLLRIQADPRWTPFGRYDLDTQVAGLAMNTSPPRSIASSSGSCAPGTCGRPSRPCRRRSRATIPP